MDYIKNNHLSLLIIVYLILSPYLGGVLDTFGASTAANVVKVTGALRVGPNGSDITEMKATTCNLSQSSAGSHAATTSKEYLCAVTGVASGDLVWAVLPAGGGDRATGNAESYGGGFLVNSAFATTSGYVGVSIYNATGGATSSIAQATTSVEIFYIDTQ